MKKVITGANGEVKQIIEVNSDDMEYTVASIPACDMVPEENEAVKLVWDADAGLKWIKYQRPLTEIEILKQRNDELEAAIIELAEIVGG